MRDSKSFFLLIAVLVLVTISFILISIWGYNYYFRNVENKQVVLQPAKTFTTGEKDNNRDSLEYILDSIINKSTDQKDSIADDNDTDSLDKTLEFKILEYRKLKSDIIEILNKKAALKDTAIVNEKISLLQQTIDELRERNNEMVSENEQLKEMVKQLTALKNPKEEVINNNNSAQKSASKSSNSLPLLVAHLRFAAINVEKNNGQITTLASQTDEFEGSFEINIKATKNNSPKIFIVILQPDKKVLVSPGSKPGIFYTSDGNKRYSTFLQFDVKKDNHKRLHFSIAAPRPIQKGKYAMQIYHGGILIGRLNKTLL